MIGTKSLLAAAGKAVILPKDVLLSAPDASLPADPILLANRIYNRYWRAPYFKNNIDLKNNLNNNLLPICSELLENQDL